LYPADLLTGAKVLFLNMGAAEAAQSLKVIATLRAAGISAELYPDAAKMKKQMAYADAKSIPYVAIIGESELESGSLTLKNMASGQQQLVSPEQAVEILK
ncbi:MAG: histidine--tRNA ligase, partial [Muribaculaceae bacterium]|nr:histidine--tRNA ligase [Muribaculaceae bacterium]